MRIRTSLALVSCLTLLAAPVAAHISPALAPLMAEADAYPEPARSFIRAGIERTRAACFAASQRHFGLPRSDPAAG